MKPTHPAKPFTEPDASRLAGEMKSAPQPLTMRELIEKATLIHGKKSASMMTPQQLRDWVEFESRCSPDTLRAVCDALEGATLALAQQPARPLYPEFHAELHKSITTPAIQKLHAVLALLNGSPAPAQQ